jgi:signal transduction histidine kinase
MTQAPAPVRLGPRLVLAAWRDISKQQLWTTFLLGCALFSYYSLVLDPAEGLDWFLRLAMVMAAAFAMLLAVAVADRATGRDPDRRGIYAVAVVTGALLGGVLEAPVLVWLETLLLPAVTVVPRIGAALHLGLELAMLGGGIVWIVNDRRRAQRARERRHAAELDRIAAERRSIESDLQAMQARVEPQFLFNTLAQVRALYREDAARGERMLDELIAYLRAAMPKMRDTVSTLGQELEFVRAYLAIVKLRLGDRLDFSIEASPGDADARMPPMMLLPLVDHAVAHGIAESRAGGAIRIRSAVRGRTVRLEIDDSGAGLLPGAEGEGVAAIRQRLSSLYGGAAGLAFRRGDDDTTTAVLQFPLEGAGPVAAGA